MTNHHLTINDIRKHKGNTPLVCLTAYTAPFARLFDSHADILLVGDSLGMVLYGMDTTLPVTVDMMCAHGKAVVNASKKALVVVDLPFNSYQQSPQQAWQSAARILQETGCTAVKLEGGKPMAETIRFLVDRGIPVMGHIGLQPQSVHADGGYHYHGKTADERERILEDARAVEAAGAFAVVLEGVVASLAEEITRQLRIPTIGIGASPSCDGQVLVAEDMLGIMGESVPSFVKRYAELDTAIADAVKQYAEEVRNRTFPETSRTVDVKVPHLDVVKDC